MTSAKADLNAENTTLSAAASPGKVTPTILEGLIFFRWIKSNNGAYPSGLSNIYYRKIKHHHHSTTAQSLQCNNWWK